jgi:hypothetical protein
MQTICPENTRIWTQLSQSVSRAHRIRLTVGWTIQTSPLNGQAITRSFRKPTGLQPCQVVRLFVRGLSFDMFSINGCVIPATPVEGLASANITDMMLPTNCVELRWKNGADFPFLLERPNPVERIEAWLEIIETAD